VRRVIPARKAGGEQSTTTAGVARVLPLEAAGKIQGVKVRQDGHVEHASGYYSVDERHCGQRVSIAEKDGEIRIYRDGELIESHPRLVGSPAGSRCSTKPGHLGPWRRACDPESQIRAARRYGKSVDELVLTVLSRGQGFIDTATIWGILGMDRSYSPSVIDKACEHALGIEAPTYKAVKVFLKLQGDRWEKRAERKTAG
jgi:hypothetical protein